MQVMPATARWTARKIGLTGFTAGADQRLRHQHPDRHQLPQAGAGRFPRLHALAAAAYNAGPGRPRAWRNGPVLEGAIWAENMPFNETRDYVKKVLSNTTGNYAAVFAPTRIRRRGLHRTYPRRCGSRRCRKRVYSSRGGAMPMALSNWPTLPRW
jgi:soluble lytic murein transglycosylase